MKIIQAGSLPGLTTYRTTCRHCGTLFEFVQSEAKYTHDQREGGFLTITCPLLGCRREAHVTP